MSRKRKSESLRQARAMKAYVERNCTKDLKLADLSVDIYKLFTLGVHHLDRVIIPSAIELYPRKLYPDGHTLVLVLNIEIAAT